MNILFIVTLSELGGAQKYVRDLALAYAKQGHRVAVTAGPDRKNTTGDWKQGWLFRQISTPVVESDDSLRGAAFRNFARLDSPARQDISKYQLPHLERSTGFIREFRTLFDIIKIINKERPEVIHLNSTKIGGLGGLAGRLMGVKTVYTVHGLVLNEPLPLLLWLWYWFLEKIAFALCSKIIVISKFDQQRVIDLNLAPARKLTLVPLTIDPEALNFLPREEAKQRLVARIMPDSLRSTRFGEHGTKENKGDLAIHYPLSTDHLIGTIANFYPTKDLPTLIEAARIVVQQKPEAKFVIIGDGPLRQSLELRIKNQELSDNVFLLGSIENASKLLPGLDLFVLSSLKEGLPQVLQEAVAAGIPIVSTNIGGIPDIVDRNRGYPWIVIKPRDPKLLAEKILFTLDNLQLNTQKPKATLKNKELLDQEFQLFTNQSFSTYEEKQ